RAFSRQPRPALARGRRRLTRPSACSTSSTRSTSPPEPGARPGSIRDNQQWISHTQRKRESSSWAPSSIEPNRPIRPNRRRSMPGSVRVVGKSVLVQLDPKSGRGRELEIPVLQNERLFDQVAPRRPIVGDVLQNQEVRR